MNAFPDLSKPSIVTGKQASLEKILRSIRLGNCCRVLGPRQRSKSTIMQTAVSVLRKDGTHFAAYQSLRDVHLTSEQNFFANLYRDVPLVKEPDFFSGLYKAIEEDLAPDQVFVGQNPPRSAFEFQIDLLRLIRRSDRNLALFIDDLEMVPPNLVAALLGVLQSVYMMVIDQPGSRFQAVVCGSLSFSQLTLDSASHFESISDLIFVGDLDDEECKRFMQRLCQEAGFTLRDMAGPALLEQTRGDRYLIQRVLEICMEQMSSSKTRVITPARIDEALELFLTLAPDDVVLERLKQLQSDANMLSCTLQLLEQGKVASSKLQIASNETPNLLDLSGLFERDGEFYQIKCNLWTRLLNRHLAAAQIGGYYAVAGYWREAIRYLGQAIREGHPDVKSELFAVVINAIHVSTDALQAYRFLTKGLRAAYPDTELRLYRCEEQMLTLIYPEDDAEQIPLRDIQRSEIEALGGPDYSLSSDGHDPYLLIPLRAGRVRTRPLGLVSLGGLMAVYSPYQQRQEVLQFVGFLHQAARAILRASLHEEDDRRRKLLEKVSSIAPEISAHLDLDGVFRAVLSGIMTAIPRADNACIVELDEAANQLMIAPSSRAYYKIDGWYDDEPHEVKINGRTGIAGRVIKTGQGMLVNHTSQDPDYIAAITSTQSELCVPIELGGVIRSVMVLESNQPNAFTPSDARLLDMLADHVGIAINNAIQFQAAQDRQLRERTAMMATGLIHDINSAVASIPDLVDELHSKLRAGRDVEGPLADLQNSALVTERVSKRLRDYVVTGQQESKQSNLEELIKNAIIISRKHEPPYVKTIYNMNGLQIKVLVDALWIELMLKNLLVNAYEAIAPESKGLVTISVEIDRESVFIHVLDNGNGISPHMIPRIFELGYSTKNKRRMQGVGLYHCRQIMQAHQGDLSVKSTQGKGTEFIVRLPRQALTDQENVSS
ncbi:MAG: GAF domain-containing protein [Chloroflexi bacterium]|nr:GAF domain-containing protein [Chloroflexota bacterium]